MLFPVYCKLTNLHQPSAKLAMTAPCEFLHFPTGLSQQDLRTRSLNKYPLTPYPTTQEPNKQPSLLDGQLSDFAGSKTGQSVKHGAFCHFMHTSASFGLYHHPPVSLRVSSVELRSVLDSLMSQVDWLEIAVQVGKRWAPSIYCNVIEKILQAEIFQLVETEKKVQDMNNDDREYAHVYKGDDENKDEEEVDGDTEVEDHSFTELLAEATDAEDNQEKDGDYEAVEEDEEEGDEYDEGDDIEEDDSEYDSV